MPSARAASQAAHERLLRRGLALECGTVLWNLVGAPVLLVSAAGAGCVALAGFGVDALIEIVASTVVVWHLKGEEGSDREGKAWAAPCSKPNHASR